MIPDVHTCKQLWDKYHLPEDKRTHVQFVAKTALFFARELQKHDIPVDTNLLLAAALLHDIDKAVEKFEGERHPDAAIRILTQEGMQELVRLISTHPLHSVLDPTIMPRTLEEKLLYLSDKMVKHEVLSVDARFDLWREEDLPTNAREDLEAAYPHAKQIEHEILSTIALDPRVIPERIKGVYYE